MAQVIAKILFVSGEVFIRDASGNSRRARGGEDLREGETLVTGNGAQVQVAFEDGRDMMLGANQTLHLDTSVAAQDKPDATDSAMQADGGDVDKIIQALNEGGDLDAVVEDTAAGAAGAGADGGHSFVQLLRIVETVSPLAYEYETPDRFVEPPRGGDGLVNPDDGEAGEADGGPSGVPTITSVDDPADPGINSVTVPEGTDAVFTVSLSNASSTAQTYSLALASGSATLGSDFTDAMSFSNGVTYNSTTGLVTVPAGVTSFTVTVPTVDDSINESTEDFTLTVGGVVGTGHITDNDGVPTITSVDDPADPGINSVTVPEGTDAVFTVSLSNASSTAQTYSLALASGSATLGSDFTDAMSFSNGVTYNSTTGLVTVPAGVTSFTVTVPTVDDSINESTEDFTLTVGGVVGTGHITDNDLPPTVSNTTSDDDDVNENRDASAANDIVHTGTISNVGASDVVTLSGDASGVTSNGKAVTYAWDATSKTLTASNADGVVFTVKVNANNTGYTFTQKQVLDHLPSVQGESDAEVLGFTLAVQGGVTAANFNVTVFDDAPTVDGNVTISAANQVGQNVMGALPVTLSNDTTDLTWNVSGSSLPTLYADGRLVQYEWSDAGDTLTGYIMDGATRENVLQLDIDLASKSYEFHTYVELLGGTLSTSKFSGTTGGNSGALQIIDANNNVILIDATGTRNGVSAQVNYSAEGISVNGGQGNWIDAGGNEVLTLAYTHDVTSATFALEPQGQSASMSWAAYREGVLVASGSVDIGKSNPEQSLTISASEAFDTVTFAAVTGQFRPEITSISYIDYNADASMNLAYQLIDSDGDTAQGTIALNLSGTPAPEIAASAATVSEEGLANSNPDNVGSPTDVTDSATFTGSMNISGDGVLSVGLYPPVQELTSGGVALEWSGVGTTTLVGSVNGSPVIQVAMQSDGSYTVTLSGPMDHAAGGGENLLSFDVGVTVSNGTTSSSNLLTVTVEDDSPTTSEQTTSVTVSQDTNVMIILDTSGSMDTNVTINGVTMTRLAAAIQSIGQMLQQYDQLGNVQVQLVTFATTATVQYSQWQSVGTVLEYLYSLSPTAGNGGTNYDAALAAAMTAFATDNKISGAQNVSYFMTDGLPTYGAGNTSTLTGSTTGTGSNQNNADVGIQQTEEDLWKTFLNSNDINSFAFAMGGPYSSTQGSATSQDYIDPIAWNGVTETQAQGQVVSDWNDLDAALQSTIPPAHSGNLLTGATPGEVGADGGHMYAISIGPDGDMRTFTWLGGDTVTQTGTGGSTLLSFDSTTHVMVIKTEQGGLFTIDLDDGAYQYVPPVGMPEVLTEVVGFELVDQDGDYSDPGQMTLILNRDTGTDGLTIVGTSGADTIVGTSSAEQIYGGSGNDNINAGGGNDIIYGGNGNDTINGGDGNDLLIGGAGNDILTGGLGADTFQWSLGDQGTKSSVAVDRITDFSLTQGDVLDLRDLLSAPDNATAAQLDNFLHFQYSGGNTTIYVSTSGEFSNNNSVGTAPYNVSSNDVQQIILEGVNLVGSNTTDQAVIQNLLNQNKLITD